MEKPQHRGRREVPSTIPLRATGGERYPNRDVEKTFGASEKTLKKNMLGASENTVKNSEKTMKKQ